MEEIVGELIVDFSATDHGRNRLGADRGFCATDHERNRGELIVDFSATDHGGNRRGADRGFQCRRS